ncbi:MAG: T9SS type A sorting domain-containing protein [Bacteroidetes bacterium]|nr:T9SS type A sorting domain-containing protein [Bacteroidota bacterium]
MNSKALILIFLLFSLSAGAQYIDENLPQTGTVCSVGEVGSDYYAQSFISNVFSITKFGLWLQVGIPAGQVKIAIVPDNGANEPDLGNILYTSTLIIPATAWHYEVDLSIPVDTGKKYYVLIDGYQNAGASGYSCAGTSSSYTDTGENFKYSNNGVGFWYTYSTPMAIYVEGCFCPCASIDGLDPWYCSVNTDVTLNLSPAGGTLTGPGTNGTIFNSSSAGPGTHELIYSYTNGSCSDIDTQQVIVYASPAADFTYSVNGSTVDFMDNSTMAATWVWDFDDGYVSTLKDVTHFFLYGGIYNVKLMVMEDSLICGDDVTKQVDMTHLGTDELYSEGRGLSLFPNPGSDLVNVIYTPLGSSLGKLRVYDALGVLQIEVVVETDGVTSRSHELDISRLAKGIYFLQLQIDEETRRLKFIKN